MSADFTDTLEVRTKSTKRYWFWGSVGCALLAWLVFWWVTSHQISVALPDGSVISYAGVLKGKRISDDEFEPDVYAYPNAWLEPMKSRVIESVRRLFEPRGTVRRYDTFYRGLPQILVLKGLISESPEKERVVAFLDDGFGKEHFFETITGPSVIRRSGSWPFDFCPLPMGSPIWRIKLRSDDNHPLGDLIVPNRSYTPLPLFVSENPPLESLNSKNVLKLVSADHSISKSDAVVTLNFDATGCPALLPCHVIGVRISDSWGNTGLIDGMLASDGKTILTKWPIKADDHSAIMQSADWHIKIAICRGYGATFAADEMVNFKDAMAATHLSASEKQTIRGREITLMRASYGGSSYMPQNSWWEGHLEWELDHKGPLLWPILVKAIGHTSDGAVVEIDPLISEQRPEDAAYQVTRNRFKPAEQESWSFTNDFLFKARFKLPRKLEKIDLHVALEEPQVFEFFAKISNWPETATKTEASR